MNKPIILFDLNGTLCCRLDKNRKICVRPYINMLNNLKKYYTLGIFSSMTYKNAKKCVAEIEMKCKTKIFDDNLIFDRDFTKPFTEEEYKQFNIPKHKTKKSIYDVLGFTNNVTIIDDELYKIVEKNKAIIIPSYEKEDINDDQLYYLVEHLIYLVRIKMTLNMSKLSI